ncbi:hypothetical protein [Christiangramia forsetii]|uniref:Lipoprotein n=2 Tax=Christiangramia forsetii TaxID=411153 RepID=A0LZY0_CHRFK|nr:hypothetical protein [Christiangramia forsetii]GGG45605.1 hypothetical protein GCM10011532_31960 [Christiangramia forsetii]CAL65925.1 hypothetical protein GFO_0951 [Christiangramia forsetii KT0803]
MKNFNSIIIILTFLSCGTQRKNIDSNKSSYKKNEIKEIAEWKYGYNLVENNFCDLYIIDGVPYDNENIDSTLATFKKSDFGTITFFKKNEQNTWIHKPCDLIAVLRLKNQKDIEKKEILIKTKNLLKEKVPDLSNRDYKCSECPVFIIDQKLIWSPYEKKKIIDGLKLSDIEFISFIKQKLNQETYGFAAKNGIIEIETK